MNIVLNEFEQFCMNIVYYVTYSIPDFAKCVLTPIFYFLLIAVVFFSVFVIVDIISGFRGLRSEVLDIISNKKYCHSFKELLNHINEEIDIDAKKEATKLVNRRLLSSAITLLSSVLVLGIWIPSLKVIYCKNIEHQNVETYYNYNTNYSEEVNSVLEDMYNGNYNIQS